MRILLPAIRASKRRSAYLYPEDFEGTGAPAGWTFNGTGTCNYDQSIFPSEGQCLYGASTTNSSAGGGQFTLPAPFPISTFGMYFRLRCGTVGTTLNRNIWICDAFLLSFYGSQSSSFGVLSPGITAHTSYHVWVDRTPTTGASYFSQTATKPASPNSSSTGTFPALSKFMCAFSRSEGFYIDKIRISASPIGSNPA